VPFYTRNYQEVDHCLGKGSTGKVCAAALSAGRRLANVLCCQVIAVRSRVDGCGTTARLQHLPRHPRCRWLYALKKIELKGAGIKDVERREVSSASSLCLLSAGVHVSERARLRSWPWLLPHPAQTSFGTSAPPPNPLIAHRNP
jgi:hypothetical protein